MSLARNIATVGSATLISRLLGFLRDVGIAAVLGAGVLSDAYFAAMQIPNLFRRLLAEGALNAAFVPMWLQIREEHGAARAQRFGEGALGAVLLALGAAAVLCVLFAPTIVHLLAPGFHGDGQREALATEYLRLSVAYVVIAGLVAIAAATLNAEGRVAAAAFGLIAFNGVFLLVVITVIAAGAGVSPTAGALLSIAVVLAGIGQLVVVGGAMLRLPTPPLRPRFILSTDLRRFFTQAIPGIIAAGIPQLKLLAGMVVASSSPAAVSWLYYAYRLYELPLGMVSVAIAAVMIPQIAASVRTRDHGIIAATQSRAFEIALGLALPSAVALAALAGPIAGGLFERGAFGARDTAAVAAALSAIALGLPGHVLEKVLGAISFAHENTRTPMLTALAGLAAAIIGTVMLFPAYGHAGIAAAIATAAWVDALLLGVILWRRGWVCIDGAAWRRLPRIMLAVAVMGAAIVAAYAALAAMGNVTGSAVARIGALALLVTLGLAVYGAMLHLTNALPLRELMANIVRY